MSKALELLREAERKLLRTPAANFVDIRERAMVVQDCSIEQRWRASQLTMCIGTC
jgi:hypothetical protein